MFDQVWVSIANLDGSSAVEMFVWVNGNILLKRSLIGRIDRSCRSYEVSMFERMVRLP